MLDLIGGTAVTMTSLVFPCIFYLYLAVGEQMQAELERTVGALRLTPEKQVEVRFKEFVLLPDFIGNFI